jgi:saccharopine dehydrogenase (NAD+, L-lysine forming)
LKKTSENFWKYIIKGKVMAACIGIRHEDKYAMERRVPIVPFHMQKLIEAHGLKFCVQSSPKRVFTDIEFQAAGAVVSDHLKDCPVIIGVKEIPEPAFEEGKTYVFFSHVIKGQSYNMPMLKRMMELKCNLIDYEKVEDELGRRLIFFGRFAGLAGMINTLWSFGQRYRELGIRTPFEIIRQAHTYNSLEDVRRDISKAGMEIARHGLPAEISPFIVAVTGYGNVSNGANEIFNLMPVIEIFPEEIPHISERKDIPSNVIYRATFREKDLAARKDGSPFELEHYYANPGMYDDLFAQYIPHLNGIVNGMYWDTRYPRIVTKSYLKKHFAEDKQKLAVIGDITCDPDGSIECTHKGTEINDPVFVYHPDNETYTMGFKGKGVLVMAVDILPSELPREASEAFSNVLKNFIPAIAKADFNVSFDELNLPSPIKKGTILQNGKLTPDYKYIQQYL